MRLIRALLRNVGSGDSTVKNLANERCIAIILKQQSLTEGGRDAAALFNHNLSLFSAKNETQRKEALGYIASIVSAHAAESLPQPCSVVLAKAQPLILDGNGGVRTQLLKLFKVLSAAQLGPIDQTLLYTRAGMSHLSTEIRMSSLDVLDWLLEANGEAVVSCAGGWIKTLRTFQNLLSWSGSQTATANGTVTNGKWSATKPTTSLGSHKLLVHQLNTLGGFLNAGLMKPAVDPTALARRAAEIYPLWHTDAHLLPTKSNAYGYLNLFGAPRDMESEMYDDAEGRNEALIESGLFDAFTFGVTEAKREGGEVGRAASVVAKALRLVDQG